MRGATVLAIAILLYAVLAGAAIKAARGHDWYPMSCCSGIDCAEVESITYVAYDPNALPTMIVKTEHGTAIASPNLPRQPSPDGRYHACIGVSGGDHDKGALFVRCLFVPVTN